MFDDGDYDPLLHLIPIPIDEAFGGEEVRCHRCHGQVSDEVYDFGGEFLCDDCCSKALAEAEEDAQALAADCRITQPIERFDPKYEYSCSREEYESGAKESHTPKSVRANNRHNCTNYDELIEGLDRYDPLDRVRYNVVRRRIDQLLDEAEEGAEDAGQEPRSESDDL